MMWKTNYEIGMELIDSQHKELFDNTEKLLNMIREEDAAGKKQECKNLILFLKEYAVQHFDAEEVYQRNIGYGDLEEHIALHKSFVNSLLEAEKKLVETDFSLPVIKEVAGFLTAWLTYHVAGVDQKLKKGESLSSAGAAAGPASSVADRFSQSLQYVLETMADSGDAVPVETVSIVEDVSIEDGIRILFEVTGERSGNIVISFPNNTAINLVKALTFMDNHQVDEMVNSAVSEVANIVSAGAVSMIAADGVDLGVEKPQILSGSDNAGAKEGFYFDSEHGRIGVSVNLS